MVTITKSTVSQYSVKLEFSNGVSMDICPHNDYVHTSLGGVELPLIVSSSNPKFDSRSYKGNNIVNIYFKRKNKDGD